MQSSESTCVVPTGIISLDLALGVGGIPRGYFTELVGLEASGKTTLSLHIMGRAQEAGGVAAFIDVDYALDPAYAFRCGVDIDNLCVSYPDTGEQALDILEALVRSGAVDVIVVDSVAALVPRAEIDGDMGDQFVGLQARLMRQSLRKLARRVRQSGAVVIFTNQLRQKTGVVFGNPEVPAGGLALRFHSGVRLHIRSGTRIVQNGLIVGNRVEVEVKKNKVAPPFRKAEFDILYAEGVSREGELLDWATRLGFIENQGCSYSLDSKSVGCGRETAKRYLRNHPDICLNLENRIRGAAGLPLLVS